MMDQVSKVGVIPPPEYPELPAPRPLVPAPDAEHVGLEAAAEAAQDGILLCDREQDGGRRWALPHVALPFNPSEISLGGQRTAVRLQAPPASTSCYGVMARENGRIDHPLETLGSFVCLRR